VLTDGRRRFASPAVGTSQDRIVSGRAQQRAISPCNFAAACARIAGAARIGDVPAQEGKRARNRSSLSSPRHLAPDETNHAVRGRRPRLEADVGWGRESGGPSTSIPLVLRELPSDTL
jgi:hypothetical protein